MYEALLGIQVDNKFEVRKGSPLEPKEKPKEVHEEEEEEHSEEDQKYIEQRLESTDVRAEQAERIISYAKAQQKPRKPIKYVWGDDARERRELKCYRGQIEREGTLTPRQTEVVTDLANGFLLRSIAEKYDVSNGAIVYHLREARERLGAISNPNLVKVAVQKGLIK